MFKRLMIATLPILTVLLLRTAVQTASGYCLFYEHNGMWAFEGDDCHA